MAGRRIIYALTWIGCFIFFLAYQEWFSWLLLCAVTALPLFSLLVSLPAMLTARMRFSLPDSVTMGTPLSLRPRYESLVPAFFKKYSVTVTQSLTGFSRKLKPGDALPTTHCGVVQCSVPKPGVCDYLGLFRFPLRESVQHTLFVRPAPIPMAQIPQLERSIAGAWRPKRGGGFSENHELRLYRPGDSVQQIHWKLSAKTGKLILREPMELRRSPITLGLPLCGDAEELDRKLGQLLWLGTMLLDKNLHFDVQCFSGDTPECWHICNLRELDNAIDAMLALTPSQPDDLREPAVFTGQYYRIGGELHEA